MDYLEERGARFEFEEVLPGGYRFRFVNANGTLILTGPRHKSRVEAVAAIRTLKANVSPHRINRVRGRSDTLYFTIAGPNVLLATSVSYSCALALEAAIESVTREAPTAPIFGEKVHV
jgi:uncharacterized protein YegP (UPF0339 family)